MTDIELTLTNLGELTTRDISISKDNALEYKYIEENK